MGSWEAHPGFYFQTRASISRAFQRESSNVLVEKKIKWNAYFRNVGHKQHRCSCQKLSNNQLLSNYATRGLKSFSNVSTNVTLLKVVYLFKAGLQTSKFSLTSLIDVCVQNGKFSLTFFLDKSYLLAYTVVNLLRSFLVLSTLLLSAKLLH